jgi:hypothetical protein
LNRKNKIPKTPCKIQNNQLFIFSESFIPWWLCFAIALLSFLLFDAIWKLPTEENSSVGIELLKGFSFISIIVITPLFSIGGILSFVRGSENENNFPGGKNIKYIVMVTSFSFLFFFFIIYRGVKNTIDVGNFPVKKEIASGVEIGNPFKFDIWESGMDESKISDIAGKNNITLYKETDAYRYVTKLLNEQANVSLYMTAKSRRLMKISINWVIGNKVEGAVLEIINKKGPIAIKKKAEFMKGSMFYKIDERNQIDIESLTGDITLIYKDIALIQQNKTEMQIKKKEMQQNLIDNDGKKF